MNLRFVIVPALSTLSLVALVMTVALAGLLLTGGGRRVLRRSFAGRPLWALACAWMVSVLATAGSLYLSEGLGLLPCRLCWYQRIAMYPLVVVLGMALLRRDLEVWRTALPLASLGALVSAYHVAVQWLPGVEATGCSLEAPCSVRYLVAYGFVTIPVMAGSAFLLVAVLLGVSALRQEP